MSSNAFIQPPKLWKYSLGAVIVLFLLIPLWTIFVMTVVQPESLTVQEQTMSNRLLWWIAGPVAVVSLLFGAHWVMASSKVPVTDRLEIAKVQQVAATDQSKREYVLEVIGLGVTLDQYRQGALWAALQKGSPFLTIREQDPKTYPYSDMDKAGRSGSRGGDSLENGALYTPMYYAVPVFDAEPPIYNSEMVDKSNDPLMGLAGGAVSSGMAWHLFVVGDRRFEERPDRILEQVFAFFDANPDVPYIVLNSDDSMGSRNLYRPDNTPALLKNGHYIPEMPDASALFVLARRERVDPVRQFVYEDVSPEKSVDELNEYGVARRLFLAYDELERAVPHPDKEKDPAAITQRRPLISEWLPTAAKFAQNADIRGTKMLDAVNPWHHHIPKDWKPTPWFPIPWNKDQLATFDKLPTLGFIHRPTFVKFTDENGKALTRRDQREKVLQAAWKDALLTLPETERPKTPARIIVATGGQADQLVALHSLMSANAAMGGPEIDSGTSKQFIDTDKRLGNTGAATLFVQMAIGVMGSYRDGGVSAAINLRDKNEASIVFISPPSAEKRKNQTHPTGAGDVFSHKGRPAIDPENYQQ
jgi:hypothetical protein